MDKYGLIGYPLKHSFSRGFFNEKFRDEGIDAEYVNFEIPAIERLPEIVSENMNLRGLNVTIPYKENIIPYMDNLSEEARHIGAVNVVRVETRKGKTHLKGFNTDFIGFTRSIEPLLMPMPQKALILGTGGASKAIRYGLRRLGVEVCFVSRSQKEGALTYRQITPEIMKEHTIVVNCTPMGMYPLTEECPPLPYSAVGRDHLLYDLIYNPEETLFLKKGRERGATTKNGLEMLLLQAYASWNIWQDGD